MYSVKSKSESKRFLNQIFIQSDSNAKFHSMNIVSLAELKGRSLTPPSDIIAFIIG